VLHLVQPLNHLLPISHAAALVLPHLGATPLPSFFPTSVPGTTWHRSAGDFRLSLTLSVDCGEVAAVQKAPLPRTPLFSGELPPRSPTTSSPCLADPDSHIQARQLRSTKVLHRPDRLHHLTLRVIAWCSVEHDGAPRQRVREAPQQPPEPHGHLLERPLFCLYFGRNALRYIELNPVRAHHLARHWSTAAAGHASISGSQCFSLLEARIEPRPILQGHAPRNPWRSVSVSHFRSRSRPSEKRPKSNGGLLWRSLFPQPKLLHQQGIT
jgi:hypothetical protein